MISDQLKAILDAQLNTHPELIISITTSFIPTENFDYLKLTIRYKVSEENWNLLYNNFADRLVHINWDPYHYDLQGNQNTREIFLTEIKYK